MILNYLLLKKTQLNNMEKTELLEMLKSHKKSYDYLILATPSGEIRNKLSEINIAIIDLIIKLEDE